MQSKIKAAQLLAEFAHGDQMYGSSPYMTHLEGVAEIAKSFPEAVDIGVTAVIVVSYLHDILEDTDVQPELLVRFGNDVLHAVIKLTKRKEVTYESYLSEIKKTPLALLVKKADTMYNLQQSVYNGNLKRIAKYTKQLSILTGVTDVYGKTEKTCL